MLFFANLRRFFALFAVKCFFSVNSALPSAISAVKSYIPRRNVFQNSPPSPLLNQKGARLGIWRGFSQLTIAKTKS